MSKFPTLLKVFAGVTLCLALLVGMRHVLVGASSLPPSAGSGIKLESYDTVAFLVGEQELGKGQAIIDWGAIHQYALDLGDSEIDLTDSKTFPPKRYDSWQAMAPN